MSEIQGDKLNIIYEDTLLEITSELMKKTIIKQDKEIERLHNIIKEVREYIEEKKYSFCDEHDLRCEDGKKILEILDKEN